MVFWGGKLISEAITFWKSLIILDYLEKNSFIKLSWVENNF